MGHPAARPGTGAPLPWFFVGHIHLGLAAQWRGAAGRAEAEFRRAVDLEPPGAFGGQSAPFLARFLAEAGRGDEVWAVYESVRPTFPSLDRINSLGAWNGMLGFVEALYLSGFRGEAASLSPLIDEAQALGPDWLAFDCRLVRTRAGVAATAGGRWEDAERHYTRACAPALRMSNDVEVADLHRLHARMLLDRAHPGDGPRATGFLNDALTDYRRLHMPGHAGTAERMLRESESRS